MKLEYCSITGADNAVNIADLTKIGQESPFVEWAILWLPAQEGQARCPDRAWIKEFSETYKDHKAMHLCGQALFDFVNDDQEALSLMKGFQRIQLNLEFGNPDGKYDPDKLIAQVKKYPQWEFIIQYTDKKKDLLPKLTNVPNHVLLFDTSAGRGISPDSWPTPIPGHVCGYAGGINPDNVARNLEIISKAAAGHMTWIDMESGVRTNDVFDLAKVRRVLDIAKPYVGIITEPQTSPSKGLRM